MGLFGKREKPDYAAQRQNAAMVDAWKTAVPEWARQVVAAREATKASAFAEISGQVDWLAPTSTEPTKNSYMRSYARSYLANLAAQQRNAAIVNDDAGAEQFWTDFERKAQAYYA